MWSSSYNHERFLFVTIEQVKKNIEHLDKKNNIQVWPSLKVVGLFQVFFKM